MRQSFPVVVMLGALLLVGCLRPNSPVALSPQDLNRSLAGVGQAVLTVHGLSCPLCSNNLAGRLKTIAGVQETVIDLESGAVTVTLKAGHTVRVRDLDSAVRDAGFTLKGIRIESAPK